MRMTLFALTLTVAGWSLVVSPAMAEIEFFGTAKVKPTYYSNFDFDDDENDLPIINEGGQVKGEHIRAEVRLGWRASGEKWSVKMIAEGDIILEKDNADRSFYIGAEKRDSPNTGGEFGIERAEFLYTFLPQLELETGWDIRFLDIQTGGLLFGDDHPFVGFRGKLTPTTKYEVLYLPVQNNTKFFLDSDNPALGLDDASSADGDWRVYTAKLSHSFGRLSTEVPASPFYANRDLGLTLSPLYAYSDNDAQRAQIHYYGIEATGQIGPIKPYFEIVRAEGEFDDVGGVSGNDISSWAMFAGIEVPVNKSFNPYAAFRFTQGDDDSGDDDVDGWVGITDIGRFTGLMGMDGNILGEDIGQSYGATLYSYSPERALASNRYGGISNAGSGDNPGQKLVAVGARGDLSAIVPKLVYKTQAFFIWYDETDNLTNAKNPGKKVDDYAGTTFDLQVLYALSKNFSVDYIFSTFIPGDGIEDQFGDDEAMVNMLTLAWAY